MLKERMGLVQQETAAHRDLRDRIRAALGGWRRFVIAIDGYDGTGKSTLGRYLAWQLGMPLVESDLFLSGEGVQYRLDQLEEVLRSRLDGDRPVLLDGIAALDVLADLDLTADYVVRIESADRSEPSRAFAKHFAEYMERHPDESADYLFVTAPDGDDLRAQFLDREHFTLSVGGALQHSRTYAENTSESERRELRAALYRSVMQFRDQYCTFVSDARHTANIQALADGISRDFGARLHNGRFRIGSAQKLLNLWLKYWWCMGWIIEPPHCPFDGVIIEKLTDHRDVRWTTLDDLETYEALVEEARGVAAPESLAWWELRVWSTI